MTPQPKSSLPPPVPPDAPQIDPLPVVEAPPAPKAMSEVSRLVGVFVSPKEAFADIVKRPRWWIPVILISIFSTTVAVAYSNRVGFDTMIRQQLQTSAQGQNMTPQQREQAIAIGSRIAQYAQYASV